MTMINVLESPLPQDMSTEFAKMNSLIPASDVKELPIRFIENSIRFLNKFKAKDIHAVIAFRTLDPAHDFIFGLAADYFPPEKNDEEMPGSWAVVASMNEEEILASDKNTIVYDLQNDLYCTEMQNLMYANGNLVFGAVEDPASQAVNTFRNIVATMFSVIKTSLTTNMANSKLEEYGYDFDKFTVSISKTPEGNIYTVELGGELKQLIKDDIKLQL